jgi:PAS domain S-box-containing protein
MKEPANMHSPQIDEAKYRMLVEAVTDYAVYMIDAAGYIISWNPGAQRFKGYTAAEILGHHFSRFYPLSDVEAGLPERALRVAAQEGRFETEGWRVRKDGTRFWAHVIIDPVIDSAGELVGFAKITRDLTERKQTEDALRRSEEQFRLLVQGVTDYAIYMVDPQGIVISWNVGAQRIKGYAPEEIIGRSFSLFYDPHDQDAGVPQKSLDAAAREGKFQSEGWRVRRDGTRFWAHVLIEPIRDKAGVIQGYAKVTRDVTEQRQAQEALEQAREALFQSQKMDALGQLTGGIAHDFNNLLMVFLSTLNLLRKHIADDDKATALVDAAIQGAQRGSTMTQRLLAFARRQELNTEAVDIPELVRGMTDLLQRALGPSISVETRFPLGLEKVYGDANQLELALLNLAINARDAMPQGGSIIIAGQPELVGENHASALPGGRYIRLSLTDTGEGMDEETLARAAEPFFTTKDVGKGTGLGLPMVHGLAEQLGGRLVLKSRRGEGTTVELWLKMVPSEAKTPPGPVAKPAPDTDSMPAVAPMVVLVVDDDNLVLMSTVAMLEDLGHVVVEATSGPQALEILRHHEGIQAMMTDHAMPLMTGVQLAEQARTQRPGLPVILASGYAELPQGTGTDLIRLRKPYRQQDLARALDVAKERSLQAPRP